MVERHDPNYTAILMSGERKNVSSRDQVMIRVAERTKVPKCSLMKYGFRV